MSRAAVRLGYTQSAVSQQIAALEREAGTKLVQRNARGIRLTEAGEALVRHAEAILARLRRDGAGKIDSIRALRDGAQMPIADGKRIVHFSAVWADTKERDEKLWDVIEDAIKGLP